MNVQVSTRRDRELRASARCFLPALAVALLAGCPSDDVDPSAGEQPRDAGSGEPDAGANEPGPSAAGALHGWFTVKLVPEMPETPVRAASPARTAVAGKLLDGPTPEATIWSVIAEEGDCELLTPRVPFCDPGCGGTALCAEDDECVPYPAPQSVGIVRATGLGAELSMPPVAGNYQPPAGTMLAYPPCEEGAEIRFEAEGAAYESFELAAKCVAPMESSGPVRIEPGEPLALTWTAAHAGVARVHIDLDISHHGGSKGKIECDVADNGATEIPAALVQELVDLGVAGFPTVTLTRVVIGNGSTAQSQVVTLTVSSSKENLVEIPGLMSCTHGSQCASGTCRQDLTCE